MSSRELIDGDHQGLGQSCYCESCLNPILNDLANGVIVTNVYLADIDVMGSDVATLSVH